MKLCPFRGLKRFKWLKEFFLENTKKNFIAIFIRQIVTTEILYPRLQENSNKTYKIPLF